MGGETKFMGGTKGSHIVVDNAELLEATKGREIFFENNDGRIVLIYPSRAVCSSAPRTSTPTRASRPSAPRRRSTTSSTSSSTSSRRSS
ncbi:hypothetical protein [Clavibacter capsici]|uniref:hypothetical protein n=1 Tax=Clavibacter capsici TaxID=1874630 RepID=UPI0035C94EF8